MRLYSEEQVAGFLRDGWWSGKTWGDLLAEHVRGGPDRVSLVDPANRESIMDGPPRRLTWAEVADEVDRLARSLHRAGIRPDDVVGLQLPNCAELAVAYLAVARLGAIACPFPVQYATHELTHTLNQIHQEQETTADNSIMTTTPSVADVLGGPATGEPGVFPDQIKLAHNTNVRHHLNHMPDPVIRPGGWPFASWFPTGAPQAADRHDFAPSELTLTVTAETGRVALGQPLNLSWTMTNTSGMSLRAPNDVRIEALFASITVTDGEGRERPVRPFAILCEGAKVRELGAAESVSASTKVFWSTGGFAFERPGRYRVDVAVSWSAQGVLVGVQGGVDVFVDYPTSNADNHAADLVLHPEVGKWVALGGDAYHLGEACRRLQQLSQTAVPTGARALAGDGAAAPRVLDGFADLLPDRKKLAKLRPELIADASGSTAREPSRTAAPGRAKRAAKARRRAGRKR